MSGTYPNGAVVELADGHTVHFSRIVHAALRRRRQSTAAVLRHPGGELTVVRQAVGVSVAEPLALTPWCMP